MAATCTGGTRANTYVVTYTGSTFSFARATSSCSPAACGTRQFRLVWSSALSTIRAVLRAPSNAPAPAWNTNPNPPSAQVFVDQGLGNGPFATADARIMLLTRASADSFIQTYDPDGTAGASPSRDVRHYLLRANRLWNGQRVSVTSAGLVCGITTPSPPASAPTVPFVQLQQVAAGCGALVGAPVRFYYAGGNFTGNQQCVDNAADNADMLDVHLNRCDDPDTTLQLAAVQTSLRPELVLSGSSIAGYSESNDGVYMGITAPTVGGIPAQGNTPIAGSLKRLKDRFDVMWANDQTPGTLQLPTDTLVVPAPASRYDIDAISTHNNPKEPTIVIFVTDGDDTCAIESGSTNNNALAAAWQAQRLYTPIVGSLQANGQYAANTDTASSVTTYVVGFGSGASVTRLNWIAWGGSGMQRPTTTQNHYNRVPTDTVTRWQSAPASAIAGGCVTCRDALVAPDADSLKAVLFSIINQGAKQGAFAAQQSVADSVFEYVDEVTKPANQDALDPRNPDNRFQGVVPVRFESSFTLPGFEGHLRAITASDDGLTGVTRWDAGRKLKRNIIAGMKTCTAAQTGTCTYPQLHAGATDVNVSTSSAAIKRRIYTTGRNGVFTTTVDNLTDVNFVRGTGQNGTDRRRVLWPPETFVTNGSLDGPLGIASLTITQLQATPYFACMGTPLLAAGCGSGTAATKLTAARKEAREMILAYLAGAEVERDNVGFPLRITTAAAGQAVGDIRYKVRSWPLNESTLSTPAVVAPPLLAEPGLAVAEYTLFRDGAKNTVTQKLADAVEQGFGLRNPDRDSTATIPAGSTTHGVDTRATQKPPMTTVFVGANDMLHAFRAGPNCAAGGLIDASASVDLNAVQPTMPAGCSELGGEELWGFVPYDQLAKVKDLLIPVTRDPHTYVIASSIRFADVFVPGNFSKSIGGVTFAGTGVWRKVLYFGRGAAGRSLTALDVTATGPFTKKALTTNGPITLWSRGNPDTNDGTVGGTKNNNNADYNAYLRMGQTWSVPSIAWTDRAYNVTPRVGEFDFVAYVGSGFSDTCPAPSVGSCSEGKALYTLDALTGDVVAATADVTTRGGISAYQNAIVAPPSAFSVDTTSFSAAEDGGHPSKGMVTRVYFGDLHGFTWKVNSANPGTLVLLEDLQSGAGLSNQPQPVTTGAALINLPATGSSSPRPHIYFESGNLKLGDPVGADQQVPDVRHRRQPGVGHQQHARQRHPAGLPDQLRPGPDRTRRFRRSAARHSRRPCSSATRTTRSPAWAACSSPARASTRRAAPRRRIRSRAVRASTASSTWSAPRPVSRPST